MATIEQHRTALSDLSAQREQLQRGIEQREARVKELEALVEEVREFLLTCNFNVDEWCMNHGNLRFMV